MNKNILLIIIISIIIIIIVSISKKNSSFSADNNFNIEDTSSINKIFLADRNNNTITLTKNDDKWIVNDEYFVRDIAIKKLLSTSNKIRIKRPVPKSTYDNVIKFMSTSGVVIEFFKSNKIVKSYIIGSNTPDHLGTYMLLKDSKKPYIVHIPTFNGFLSPRYGIQGNLLNIEDWRSHSIFNLTMEEINYIKYTDFLNNKNSYFLKKDPVELMNYQNKPQTFNRSKVKKLLNSFEKLNCEAFKKININSLSKIEELVVNLDTLTIYKVSDLEIKKENNYTVSRKYATLNNGDLMLIQDFVFNKVLINFHELNQ